ncbi:cytochrome C peroxidase [Nostoc calcicola FACHB-3891]|nr:cytochrome C peroxidase [Nostoc calcicola FACHB-3891]
MRKIQFGVTFVAAVLARLRDLVSRLSRRIKSGITIAALVAMAVLAGHTVSAQVLPPTFSLKTVTVPEPDNLGEFVKDKTAAIALGKAFFWDMQIGSDGITSCASCHFHAGADNRAKNELSPGILRVNADKSPNPDNTFSIGQPNYTLKPEDYPFHKLADPNNRFSPIVSDSNDVTSSQGVFNSKFVNTDPGTPLDDPVFNVGGIETRRVEPRNTPTVINAVFNFRNFWDGRAQNVFNGVNAFGTRDPNAKLYKSSIFGSLQPVSVRLKNAALASQAVAPPLSSFEMSADGRTFQEIGDKFGFGLLDKIFDVVKGKKLLLPRELAHKLLPLRPLGKQIVHHDDSVLGHYSRAPQKGLTTLTYGQMIKAAFKPEWWQSTQLIQVDKANGNTRKVVLLPDLSSTTEEYTQMEYNFSLFFGLAVQMYESTLVSDNAPIDQFSEGNTGVLSPQQQRGKEIFENPNNACIFCHSGPEFTAASVRNVQNTGRITRSPAPGNPLEDTGWFKIGVRPELEDVGVGADDGVKPVSRPLSEARLALQGKFQEVFGEAPNIIPGPNDKVEDGLFKAPTLRNVELTAPYMHNGGMLTLRQVVDFYSRGAGDDNANVPRLPPLNLNDADKEALVAFLKALTDERVRYEKAPFDHPQLFVPNGHLGNETYAIDDGTGKAKDDLVEIPPVGRNGRITPPANFLATP